MKRIIIVEDEENISDLLQVMIKRERPDWLIEGVFQSVTSTVDWLLRNPQPDLIFMDIQLNDGISFSIFEQVEVISMIIFTTAYDDYAIKAFDVNSIDYLLKPVRASKLLKSIEKFESFETKDVSQHKIDYKDIFNFIKNKTPNYRTKFLIQSTTSYYTIFTNKIAYFYIENRVLFAVTSDNKEHTIEHTLDTLEQELDPDLFFRANRSTIINVEFVIKFENYFGSKLSIRLKPVFDKTIIVSRLKATEFKNWMGK